MKKVLYFILGVVTVVMGSVTYYLDIDGSGGFGHMVRFALGSILLVAGIALIIHSLPSFGKKQKHEVRDTGIVVSGRK